MKILLTGCDGYLGSTTLPTLLAAGYDVVGVDSLIYTELTDRVLPLLNQYPGRFTFFQTDFRNLDQRFFETTGVTATIHLAGISNDPTAEMDDDLTYAVNTEGTERLARAAAKAKARRFVFASSASVYDCAPGFQHHIFDEGARLTPVGAYSQSKYFAEQHLGVIAHTNGLEVVNLRQGTVFGVSGRMRYDLVLQAMTRDALCRQAVIINGDGKNRRPLLNIKHAAFAHQFFATVPWDATDGDVLTLNVVSRNIVIEEIAWQIGQWFLAHQPAPPTITKRAVTTRLRDYAVHGTAARRRMETPLYVYSSLYQPIADIVADLSARTQPYDPRLENLAWLQKKGMVRAA